MHAGVRESRIRIKMSITGKAVHAYFNLYEIYWGVYYCTKMFKIFLINIFLNWFFKNENTFISLI